MLLSYITLSQGDSAEEKHVNRRNMLYVPIDKSIPWERLHRKHVGERHQIQKGKAETKGRERSQSHHSLHIRPKVMRDSAEGEFNVPITALFLAKEGLVTDNSK